MANYMMAAIEEFSKRHPVSDVSLVRVVIFESDMVDTYLDQMYSAGKSGSGIMDTVKGYVKGKNLAKH